MREQKKVELLLCMPIRQHVGGITSFLINKKNEMKNSPAE